MTATLQDLYDDIKELIHQKFETKTEEDATLPQIVESYFNYNQGELEISMPYMELTVTGSSFSTYSSTPFTYNGLIFVDWGDSTDIIEYTGGQLSHSFIDGLSSHTVRVYGDLTSLEKGCFFSCSSLTSVKIPNSVTSLKENCFLNTGLTSIEIPDGVTSLGGSCFWSCTGLTSINISSSVTSLGFRCFAQCTGLTSIQLNWTGNSILTYDSYWILNTNSNLKFHIPTGATEDYIQAGYPSDKLVESD